MAYGGYKNTYCVSLILQVNPKPYKLGFRIYGRLPGATSPQAPCGQCRDDISDLAVAGEIGGPQKGQIYIYIYMYIDICIYL